ncbi:plasmid mobilization protein [Mucilaginibacter paludis]|uniref:Mobilization protein n=1 Tax=Mucilaginibacter paludis DSM 18603 TaxID=714943 RepID=H1YDX6_9SPHI|nr:plasmid mobilization relaxosome protein MobC [Mucilaginibacter paludis]EHQ24316.1 mobilization protein [Mucilaginibacter paludis DSM 18603]
MSRADKEILKHEIKTRVNDAKFNELNKLLNQSSCQNMSELVRHILHERPVIIGQRNQSLDLLTEELSGIRKELRSIGININQITKQFNTFPEKEQKLLQALGAAEQYRVTGNKVDQLLTIITKLSEQWLPK